jgi:hypothetical protein
MNTREAVIAYLKEKAWPYVEKQEFIKVDIEGDNCMWQSFITIDDALNCVIYYSVFPNRILAEKQNMMETLITEMNLGFKVGNFELNREGGELRYKTYQMFPDGDYSKRAFLDNVFISNIYAMNQTVDILNRSIFSDMTKDQIMEVLDLVL